MALLTLEDAIQAAVQQANRIGRAGNVVEYIKVLPPSLATQNYMLVVGPIRPPTIDD